MFISIYVFFLLGLIKYIITHLAYLDRFPTVDEQRQLQNASHDADARRSNQHFGIEQRLQ